MKKETKPVLEWSCGEYEQYERGTLWYAVAGLVVGLLLIWSILSDNFLFGVIVVMVSVVVFLRHIHSPQQVLCQLTQEGVRIGSRLHAFSDLVSFALLEHDDERNVLYIREKNGMKNIISLPVQEQDVSAIRLFLKERVTENKEQKHELLWEALARLLKL